MGMLRSEALQLGWCVRTNFQLPDFFSFSHHLYDLTLLMENAKTGTKLQQRHPSALWRAETEGNQGCQVPLYHGKRLAWPCP